MDAPRRAWGQCKRVLNRGEARRVPASTAARYLAIDDEPVGTSSFLSAPHHPWPYCSEIGRSRPVCQLPRGLSPRRCRAVGADGPAAGTSCRIGAPTRRRAHRLTADRSTDDHVRQGSLRKVSMRLAVAALLLTTLLGARGVQAGQGMQSYDHEVRSRRGAPLSALWRQFRTICRRRPLSA
jgi:hypothetical protein